MSEIKGSYFNKSKRTVWYYSPFDITKIHQGITEFNCLPFVQKIPHFSIVSQQNTYMFDLTCFDYDTDLLNILKKDIRNSYNYCCKNNIVFHSVKISKNNFYLVEEMNRVLKQLYKCKKLKFRNFISLYKSFMENDNLYLTYACIGNNKIVFHLYLVNNSISYLLRSCSAHKNSGENRNLIGKANRGLHIYDMLYFKSLNVVSYDWGGLFSIDKSNSIDSFKTSFPGKTITYTKLSTYRGIVSVLIYLKKRLRGE